MKTAISIPDETFTRAEAAAAKLGISRSQFYARAAERWLAAIDDRGTTTAIDRVLAEAGSDPADDAFVRQAAAGLAEHERSEW